MDDLISREEAIDAIYEHEFSNWFDKGEVSTVLNDLPSVQSDAIPLEWIDKHLEWLDNCENGFAQLAKAGIRAMVEIWKEEKT